MPYDGHYASPFSETVQTDTIQFRMLRPQGPGGSCYHQIHEFWVDGFMEYHTDSPVDAVAMGMIMAEEECLGAPSFRIEKRNLPINRN